jgi:hypothetical protein
MLNDKIKKKIKLKKNIVSNNSTLQGGNIDCPSLISSKKYYYYYYYYFWFQ